MTIFTMHKVVSVSVSGVRLSASAVAGIYAVAGIPANHRADWAPAAAAPQHKRRTADGIAESVNRGTT